MRFKGVDNPRLTRECYVQWTVSSWLSRIQRELDLITVHQMMPPDVLFRGGNSQCNTSGSDSNSNGLQSPIERRVHDIFQKHPVSKPYGGEIDKFFSGNGATPFYPPSSSSSVRS